MKKAYPDEEILESIRASAETREQVFEYLFLHAELKNMAFSRIKKMIRDDAVAEDIFLDSLLAFIKNVRYNKFQGKSKVFTYIVGICAIHCLRYLEKQKKEKGKADEYGTNLMRNIEQEYQLEAGFLWQEGQKYEARLTRRIYRQLSEGCRKAFRQRYGKEMTDKAIAEANEVGVQSVKNTFFRCRQKLKDLIMNDTEIMEIIKKRYGKK